MVSWSLQATECKYAHYSNLVRAVHVQFPDQRNRKNEKNYIGYDVWNRTYEKESKWINTGWRFRSIPEGINWTAREDLQECLIAPC